MHARTRLAAGVLAAASAIGFTVAQATAATTAQVQNGTLFIAGTDGPDDITLLPSAPNVLDIDAIRSNGPPTSRTKPSDRIVW